jgi:replicative DNA helicase
MNIVEHLTVDLKLPVAVFSLEMSNQQLMQRMLCSGARVNLARVRDGFLSERDFPALQSAASKLAETKLYIDDASDLTIQELRGRARRLKQQHDIQAVVIDYLQLVRSNSRQAGNNREREVAEVSAGTKALAKELGLPVIVLAQLSRYDKGSRGGEAPRPRLSDLRESGCLSGETTVHYRKRNSRIDELSIDADKKGEIVCVMENKSVSSDPKLPRKTGRKPVLKLTLSTGHTIRATANHKFLSAGRIWLPLSELSAGDLIAIPLNSPTGKRATVSLAEARLLGLMTSNGCCLPRRSIQLTMNSGDSDVVRIAERDAKEVFHTIRPYHKHETPSTRPGCKWIQVFFPSKVPPSKKRRSDMAMWLERHGLWNKRAKEKQIPPAIFNQPKSVIAEFLSALFSGDGSCGIQATGSKHEYIVASYSSASKELIYGVQWLLQTLGIISGISTVKCRGFVSFTLQVYSRSNKLRFAELVGFLGSRKSKTMKSVVSAMMSAQMGWEKYIADGDLAFVPIRKIEADGIADVWDIEVPINHNFIANGIVVHNSIEQDADIVAFLTRDELYAETDEEKEAALGKATLTIAKSRNGPVGDIPLTFLKEFTLFCSRARESDDDQPTEQQTELPV